MRTFRLGISIKNVMAAEVNPVIAPGHYRPADLFPGCLDTIVALQKRFGPNTCHIISETSSEEEKEAYEWLLHEHWQITARAGIPPDNLIVYVGSPTQKRMIAIQHDLRAMLDSKLETLAEMPAQVRLYGFRLDIRALLRGMHLFGARDVIRVLSWNEFAQHLERDL